MEVKKPGVFQHCTKIVLQQPSLYTTWILGTYKVVGGLCLWHRLSYLPPQARISPDVSVPLNLEAQDILLDLPRTGSLASLSCGGKSVKSEAGRVCGCAERNGGEDFGV